MYDLPRYRIKSILYIHRDQGTDSTCLQSFWFLICSDVAHLCNCVVLPGRKPYCFREIPPLRSNFSFKRAVIPCFCSFLIQSIRLIGRKIPRSSISLPGLGISIKSVTFQRFGNSPRFSTFLKTFIILSVPFSAINLITSGGIISGPGDFPMLSSAKPAPGQVSSGKVGQLSHFSFFPGLGKSNETIKL